MTIEKERELFKQAYLNLRTSDSIPFPDAIFDEYVRLRDSEGYKLVPVELIKSCNDIAVDCFNKWDIKKEAMPGICELMQDFSYYLQSHDRSL